MARFFILTINYAPEPTGFAPKATALAEHLARRGHSVSVFTGFPFAPEWHRRPEDRGRVWARTRSGNLTVYRLTHYIPRTPASAAQRILMEGSFSGAALLAQVAVIAGSGRPDAILYIGAQPALAMLARVVSSVTGRPYFVNITDLAAEAAADVGIVGPRLSRLLETIEFAAYRGAAGASVLSHNFARALTTHRFPSDRIRVRRDATDLTLIRPVLRDGRFRAAHGIPDEAFVLMYAGSMGLKQGLQNVVAAAALTCGTNIRWLLVGDGEMRAELMQVVRDRHLEDTVSFIPFQHEEDLSMMFAAADVLLLNQIAAMKDTVVPSKLLTYMAAGRPVLAAVNAESQAAEIVREAGGGLLIPPEHPDALAEAARQLAATNREELAAFGARNRAYAEEHFDADKIHLDHEAFLVERLRAAATSR